MRGIIAHKITILNCQISFDILLWRRD